MTIDLRPVRPDEEHGRAIAAIEALAGRRHDWTDGEEEAGRKLDAAGVEAGLPGGTTVEGVRHSILLNTLSFHAGGAGQGPDLRTYAEPSE